LHERVGGRQQGYDCRASTKALHVEAIDRDDDAKTKQVQKYRKKSDKHRTSLGFLLHEMVFSCGIFCTGMSKAITFGKGLQLLR